MKGKIACLLVLMMLIGLSACAKEETVETETEDKEVVIIYTNDVHTYMNNTKTDEDGNEVQLLTYGSIAAMKESYEAEGKNVILADDGDFARGTAYGMDEGKTAIELMNAAGYDIATLGNHEFDFGQYRLFGLIDEAEFPIVSCNFYNMNDESTVLPSYEIVEKGGVKVAFIGITTPETYASSNPTYFNDEAGNQIYSIYGLTDNNDLYESVQKAIDEVKDQADYVVALGHLGTDEASMGWRSIDVIENTSGLDAFIDGHSHTVIEGDIIQDKDGNDVLLTSTGCYLENIGVMQLNNDSITSSLVSEYENRDETVDQIAKDWVAAVNEELGETLGTSEVDFTIYEPGTETRIVRGQETNNGDMVADSYYYYFNGIEMLDCDVAVANGGGVRADIPAGNVSYLSVKTVEPFGNQICLVKMTGQELLDALEYSSYLVGEKDENGNAAEFGGFLHVAGLKFTIDASIPSTVQINSEGIWTGPSTGDYKVSDVEVYNKETHAYEPLDLEKEYTVAGNNYILRNSGNGYSMLADTISVKDYVGEDYLITSYYLKAFKDDIINSANSPITYENYLLNYEDPHGSGRINIINY